MKFGAFDDSNREYVITTPRTPSPWINYLGTGDFFGLISNTGGGYCFYKDARLRRITRYRYNGIPTDTGGRYFFINDSGDVWTPSWQPLQVELDYYECRHGLGYTKISGARGNIRVDTLFFVPVGKNCEIHKVTVTNTGETAKAIKLFSYIEFCLWNAFDDMANYQRNLNTGEVEVEEGIIYHKTEYRERRNHYAFYGVNVPVSGFDTDREAFLGPYGGLHSPRVVLEGRSRNSLASGWSPIASHLIALNLSPGEAKDLVFVLGYAENDPKEKWEKPGIINKAPARKLLEEFCGVEAVDMAFLGLREVWADQFVLSIKSGLDKLDRMVNIWNPYQCMITFNLARSASYFESGISRGIGFRDSNQDILGVVAMVPAKARQRILDLAATQAADGSAYHQYQPLTKKGNTDIGGGFNDDPLWLVYSTIAYIKETGDYGILQEDVPFGNDQSVTATLHEHLRRSLQFVLNNLGPHGLPLIGHADWNDCLNLNCFSTNPDESFQTTVGREGGTAESVFIAAMFVHIGPEYARLCRKLGMEREAINVLSQVARIRQAVIEHGYDGNWFLRAYDANGQKVGSNERPEGKIFVETQGLCVMAGIGLDNGYARKALDSTEQFLATAHGIKLVYPAFTSYHPELGEITSYPPGYKENAGIFCHNNPWVMIAETMVGRPEKAFDYYKRIAPAFREEISEIHRMEPYVYSQMIAGDDAVRHGEAKNSWLTGTAAWNYVAITQHILGIRPDFDGLVIDPCLPRELFRIQITRVFRGVRYEIEIANRCRGQRRLVVDGKEVPGTLIPAMETGKSITVQVET